MGIKIKVMFSSTDNVKYTVLESDLTFKTRRAPAAGRHAPGSGRRMPGFLKSL